jgi:hypothetical protein
MDSPVETGPASVFNLNCLGFFTLSPRFSHVSWKTITRPSTSSFSIFGRRFRFNLTGAVALGFARAVEVAVAVEVVGVVVVVRLSDTVALVSPFPGVEFTAGAESGEIVDSIAGFAASTDVDKRPATDSV